jgi:tetratricopeptide (TPR) repeat protein
MRVYVSIGKYEKVIELFEKNLGYKSIKELSDSFLGYLGIAFYKTGERSKSTEFMNELSSRGLKNSAGSPFYFEAMAYTAMDDKEKAIKSLQKAYSEHEVDMVWLKVDPLFQLLHGDPQYEDLVHKIGFK